MKSSLWSLVCAGKELAALQLPCEQDFDMAFALNLAHLLPLLKYDGAREEGLLGIGCSMVDIAARPALVGVLQC